MAHPASSSLSPLGKRLVMLAVVGCVTIVASLAWVIHTHLNSPATPATVLFLPRTYAPVGQQQAAIPDQRVYFISQKAEGATVMASDHEGAAAPVTVLPDRFGQESDETIQQLALSPSRQYLAIDGQRDHGDVVWVLDTQSLALRAVPDDAIGNFLHWLPDGRHFLYHPVLPAAPTQNWHPGLWIVDAATGSHVDVPLPDGRTGDQIVDAVAAPDGTRLLVSLTAGTGLGSSIWTMAPDGKGATRLFASDGIVGLFSWSPDGQQIAYQRLDDSAVPFRPASLWLMQADSLTRTQIAVADGGHGYTSSWSPDGKSIAYVQRLNDQSQEANRFAGLLVSAIATYSTATHAITIVATPDATHAPRNINPVWRDNHTVLFSAMEANTAQGTALSPASLWLASGNGAQATTTAGQSSWLVTALQTQGALTAGGLVATVGR